MSEKLSIATAAERIYEVVEKCGGMQVNDKKDVPVSADNVKNLNTERK